MTKYAFIGSFEKVREGLTGFIEEFQLDEVMITTTIYDDEKKLKSLYYTAEALKSPAEQNQL
jgi:alkanesulfonate monooxygenase SsuD/methylene tetrahydromethanopterin reductase-like flavin-dependent oxidoreductase (luciferase family)